MRQLNRAGHHLCTNDMCDVDHHLDGRLALRRAFNTATTHRRVERWRVEATEATTATTHVPGRVEQLAVLRDELCDCREPGRVEHRAREPLVDGGHHLREERLG